MKIFSEFCDSTKEINMVNKWKESIKKIPQKDKFELKGIKNWHINHFEMIPNAEGIHEQLFREEAVKLLAAGFDLAINVEHGVGSICITKDEFVIELWQYNKKKLIHKKTLDEVLDWIIYFYDH
jgi:hypothetical protein